MDFRVCFILLASNIGLLVLSEKTRIVVSANGDGDYQTISKAVSAVPDYASTQYVIYIKKGLYNENVYIGREKMNIMVLGEGIGKTVIVSNKSQKSGHGMIYSATFDTNAPNFVAKDITFVNSAGPDAGPALAVRSAGKNDAFHRCAFEGYQDTLLLSYGRKFLSECSISGTVDFICGDAPAVFQNTHIYVRDCPLAVITAESRDRLESNTGFVLHNCTVVAAPAAASSPVKAFLGRPWRDYSRVVVMQSYLGSVVDSKGWMKKSNRSKLDQLFYGEFENRGPGAAVGGRVKWPGYKVLSRSEALPFTVKRFLGGTDWLNENGIPVMAGLI